MTLSKFASHRHVIALPVPLWGHVKPLSALIAKIVKLRNVHVTFFTADSMLEKTLDEIARQFQSEEEGLKNLIRVVALPCAPIPFEFGVYYSSFISCYRTLHEGKPIAKIFDEQDMYEGIEPPQLAILDYFAYEAMKTIRAISGHSVPIYALQHSCLSAAMFFFGPEYMGGLGDLDEKIRRLQEQYPETYEDEVVKMFRREYSDALFELPGIPPMHNYEQCPQMVSLGVKTSVVPFFCRYVHRLFSDCDGIINCTTSDYEPGALAKLKEWAGSRPVFSIGSPSPPANAAEIEKVVSTTVGAEVKAFLDAALDKHGENSVIFISFGTVWWSAEPEKIWTIFDVLIEHGIPFVFSHASPAASIPEDVATKIQASGLGYTANWLPQQMILQHKACGWFMSHCGHNSVMESLTAGVPLICWPFDADQPMNAANISFTHEAGYELFEVRTGQGLRPVHRLGDKAPLGTLEAVRRETIDVLAKARGDDGKKKRAKAQWFSQQFARSWESGGPAWEELARAMEVLA